MEMDGMMFWNIVLTLVIAPAMWAFRQMYNEVKRLQLLLSETRETYARRDDVREDMGQVMQHLHRIEDKLDKVLTR
ncbi:MAG: hypothetical protein CMF19_03910 [Idiomarinaceae bacterium]|jgi:membrane protein insertase Oxa1/YidC/SpoIIIJ|nr:hypothetical protein [Idiomarinaceae bacterium]